MNDIFGILFMSSIRKYEIDRFLFGNLMKFNYCINKHYIPNGIYNKKMANDVTTTFRKIEEYSIKNDMHVTMDYFEIHTPLLVDEYQKHAESYGKMVERYSCDECNAKNKIVIKEV